MKLFFVSLGCDKNLVDSEKMMALLQDNSFEITDDEREAEVIVVNTCCFIHDAKTESIETIIEMGQYKKTGKCKYLIVAGCLAQRYAEEMQEEMPEVDAVIGTTAYDQVIDVINNLLEGEDSFHKCMAELEYLPKNLTHRGYTPDRYTSYIKIAEGCDKFCSYCIIPKLRGRYRSVPMEEVLAEARELVDNGTRELILVAQETTLYGKDLYGEKKLGDLLSQLCAIEDLQWVRVLYCYPEEIDDTLIEAMKKEPKVCHYLDMPIQHCNDDILKKMGRRTSKQELVDIIGKLRNEIPNIALRTTLITGFPSETKEQHEELLQFVWDMKFDRLGVFTYSPEEDTRAAEMPDQVDESVKHQRYYELMEAQREIVFERNEQLIGEKLSVIVDGFLPEENTYVGRSYMDAPGVDGNVFFEGPANLVSGTILDVLITDAKGYDLAGVID